MFSFIPIELYTSIYYHALLIIMLLIVFSAMTTVINDESVILNSKFFGYILLIISILYMGLRPISWAFGDMGVYAKSFKTMQQSSSWSPGKEPVFEFFMYVTSRVLSVKQFFLLVDLLYIVPCFLFSKKYFGKYWFYVFFLFLASFSFWTYGTNGIRNGLATAIFILSLCFYERKIIMYLLMILAYGIHNSIMIPIVAFLLSGIYKEPKIYLYIWLAAIPLSLVGGSFWESFFGGLGFSDDRASDYLINGEEFKDQFSQTGFRWDFVFYSAFAVVSGWYFIFKRHLNDKFYIHLWGTYMIANAFWILVIRAAFSNRFAYLSWFLMAPVIAYPILKYVYFKDQFKPIAIVTALYYLFTYILFLLYL